MIEETLSSSTPPNDSGTSVPSSPSPPQRWMSVRASAQSFCSSCSSTGITSVVRNSSAVWPIRRCSSVSFSGVNIAFGRDVLDQEGAAFCRRLNHAHIRLHLFSMLAGPPLRASSFMRARRDLGRSSVARVLATGGLAGPPLATLRLGVRLARRSLGEGGACILWPRKFPPRPCRRRRTS